MNIRNSLTLAACLSLAFAAAAPAFADEMGMKKTDAMAPAATGDAMSKNAMSSPDTMKKPATKHDMKKKKDAMSSGAMSAPTNAMKH